MRNIRKLSFIKNAASIGTLEKAWRKIGKGRLIRKDYGSTIHGSKLDIPGGKFGPATIPAKGTGNTSMSGKFMIKGQNLPTLNARLRKNGLKTSKQNKDSNRGVNATLNLHESDEMKQFAKSSNPQTQAGQVFSHHSLAKILGPESNRLATASDAATKKGGKALKRTRKSSGEKEIFDHFSLADSKGNKPYAYGKARSSRAYRKAMYKKELGMPKASKDDITVAMGGKTKSQRKEMHEAARRAREEKKIGR